MSTKNEDIRSNEPIKDPYGNKIDLTDEQKRCVDRKSSDRQQVIKGVAGSGKSLVLLAKAKRLISQQTLDERENDIAFFGFNNTLVEYAREYLDPDNKREKFLKICTLDSHLCEIYKDERVSRLPNFPKGKIIMDDERNQEITKILNRHRSAAPYDRLFRIRDSKWQEEIKWALDNGVTDDEIGKRRYLGKELSRRGCNATIGNNLQSAYNIICEYIREIRAEGKTEKSIIYTFLERNISCIPPEYRFNHVLIDEAQDLSLTMIRIAAKLFTADMTIAMDSNQRIYKNHWRMMDIGVPLQTDRLGRSFRCTKQIDDLAECIKSKKEDDEPDVTHVSPEGTGELPVIIECSDKTDEMECILDILKDILSDERLNVAVMFKTNDDMKKFAEFLYDKDIRYEIVKGKAKINGVCQYNIRSPGVKLCTVNGAKGLEFHYAVIPYFDDRYAHYSASEELEAKNRNMLYVAMTRARINLYITYSGRPSEFLDEFRPELYELIERE